MPPRSDDASHAGAYAGCMKLGPAARCARPDRGQLPPPRHPLSLVGPGPLLRRPAGLRRDGASTCATRCWTPDPLILTIPLVLVAPSSSSVPAGWLPWWLDSLPALVAAGWLLSVAPTSTGSPIDAAPGCSRSSPPRSRPATDCGRASPSVPSRTASSAPPRPRPRHRRLPRPRHPARGRLRRRRDAAVADARAGRRADAGRRPGNRRPPPSAKRIAARSTTWSRTR